MPTTQVMCSRRGRKWTLGRRRGRETTLLHHLHHHHRRRHRHRLPPMRYHQQQLSEEVMNNVATVLLPLPSVFPSTMTIIICNFMSSLSVARVCIVHFNYSISLHKPPIDIYEILLLYPGHFYMHAICWRGQTRTINVMCGKKEIDILKHQVK